MTKCSEMPSVTVAGVTHFAVKIQRKYKYIKKQPNEYIILIFFPCQTNFLHARSGNGKDGSSPSAGANHQLLSEINHLSTNLSNSPFYLISLCWY